MVKIRLETDVKKSNVKKTDSARVSLASKAYDEIKGKILRGELSNGIALSRRMLARELGMSLPPVYEAIQQLETEGLLESKPQVGTRLRIPTKQDVLDRGMVREALESQSARLFAERASAAEKKELVRRAIHLDQLYADWKKGQVDHAFLYNLNTEHMRLHLYIAECSRCFALTKAIEREQVLIFNWLYDTVEQRRVSGRNFHAKLAAALTSGNPAKADKEMRNHIRFGLREVLSAIGRVTRTRAAWRLPKTKP